jgi:hypothetical protein
MLRSTLRFQSTNNGRKRSLLPCTPIGLVTLVAIAAVAIAAVTVPSVIIRIAAVVTSVVAVLGIAFVHNLAVLGIIAIIIFFSRAINKIIRNLITIVINLILQ